ncbi:MAG: helix-turn-helix transcriptional regulator [Tannerellaceae bacterium]|jgi:AraC-like DNA-binding protein|nr:helix-turn-helix transcriptional regulator [Tannerellaceae bacterium]
MKKISHIPEALDEGTTPEISFKSYDMPEGCRFYKSDCRVHHLICLLQGELSVHYNEFQAIRVKEGELFLIPGSAAYSLTALSTAQFVACTFGSLNMICNKLNFRIYTAMLPLVRFTFTPLPIHAVLNKFLLLLLDYMQLGMNGEEIYTLKFKELFLLLGYLYNKEEMSGLFYPILGQSPDFKNRVIQYFPYVNNINELARKMGMGRANFDIKFKKEFGVTPLQWILKEKAKHVYFSLSEPENTLTDIMNKYNFNSSTHLNRFCRQQFGCSPSELRKKLTTNE